ncbi:MAG TPA: class I SAM-dependent methyltransferase [Terriglobia bacterium]|nr:class I SAM-dependent methyltransferase [Terriglobia bacterium]
MKPATQDLPVGPLESRRPSKPASPEPRSVSVTEGHTLWAQTYDLAANPLLALEERIVDDLLPGVEGKVVLDVACGTGRWLRKLKAKGARAGLGIDLSAEMLTQAARKLALKGSLIRGDARALPLRSGIADLVLSSFVAGYIDDLRAFAGELARVSRPGGLIIVSDFHPSNHSRRWRRTFRLGAEVLEIRSFVRPTTQLCAEFEACGLELETCLEPCFDEPERRFFDQCGRGDFFEDARSGAAIFICLFRRRPETVLSETKP